MSFPLLAAVAALLVIGGLLRIDPTALAQQASGRGGIAFPTTIQWSKQEGVTKYRFQIAEDEKFSSVFYDGLVSGERYTATGLAPGYYYWRTVPASSATAAFSKPVRFFVSGGVAISGSLRSTGSRPRLRALQTSKGR